MKITVSNGLITARAETIEDMQTLLALADKTTKNDRPVKSVRKGSTPPTLYNYTYKPNSKDTSVPITKLDNGFGIG